MNRRKFVLTTLLLSGCGFRVRGTAELPFETLCPGQTALQALMEKYR